MVTDEQKELDISQISLNIEEELKDNNITMN
jgi:hypothetical protein